MRDLRGRVVVVTGAGSGIGRATALAFAAHGARVHAADLDGDAAGAVAETIGARGGEARAHAVDVTDGDAVEALAETVYRADGRVDVLHNNAGIGHAAPFVETRLEDWQAVLAVNLWGPILGSRTFVPRMIEQGGGGHVVHTSSGLGLVAAPGMAPYTVSKFGVVGLTEVMAAELAPHGIRVSAICPGIVDTAIVRRSRLAPSLDHRRDETVRFYERRGARPEEVARAVLRAVRTGRMIVTVPRWHVVPAWALKRLSSSLYAGFLRAVAPRLMRR